MFHRTGEVHILNGDVALVPVEWVEMPTEAEAREPKQILDGDGTGNVTEISREQGRYRTVRYTGDAYASRRNGTIVVKRSGPTPWRAAGPASRSHRS